MNKIYKSKVKIKNIAKSRIKNTTFPWEIDFDQDKGTTVKISSIYKS